MDRELSRFFGFDDDVDLCYIVFAWSAAFCAGRWGTYNTRWHINFSLVS
jgi:hypothetical protein